MRLAGRGLAGAAIVVAWLGGLGMLVRREFFRPSIDRLAEAALRVQPGAVFYAVMDGDRQVGFASSTIDTSFTMIEQREYLVADIRSGGTTHRATARTNAMLTRALRLRSFEVSVEADSGPLRVLGEVQGDTTVKLDLRIGSDGTPDTARIALPGPILLASQIPLAVALEERPSVGKSYLLPLFEPTEAGPRDLRVTIRAESSFVVNDSAVFDRSTGRWVGSLPVTVRAWQLVADNGSGVNGWVDEQGRLVATSQMGLQLVRRPYEVAFENWRLDTEGKEPRTGTTPGTVDNILMTTLLAANKRGGSATTQLLVRLSGVPLNEFRVRGGRQVLRNDTLRILRESPQSLDVLHKLTPPARRRYVEELGAQEFLEIAHPEIMALAARLVPEDSNPRIVAQRINQWVHDSVRKEVTTGIPSALHVLHTRRGDANEHAQLYVAIARAAGLPARVATGFVRHEGRFYYHAWPEVLLRGWVAVDPTLGQFPADADHVRFMHGGVSQQAHLLRRVGHLRIDIINSR
jgi:hypothetical protein